MLLINERPSSLRRRIPTSPVAHQDGLEIVALFSFLRRHLSFIAICCAACLALGAFYVLFIPPRFAAHTTLLLDVKKPRAVQDQDAIPTNVAELGYVESQVVVLQSYITLERVVHDLSLADDPDFNGVHSLRLKLQKLCQQATGLCSVANVDDSSVKFRNAVEQVRRVITVQRIGASQVIEITATLHDPDKAAKLANAVLTSYMDYQSATSTRLTQDAIKWLESRIQDLRKQALEADRRLQDFKSGNSSGPVDQAGRAFVLRDLLSASENQQALYQGFMSRYAQTAQQLSFPLSDVRVLTPASPPTVRSGPSNMMTLALSCIGGIAIGLVLATVRDRIDRRLRTKSDVETLLGLPCLAVLPWITDTTPATGLIGMFRPLEHGEATPQISDLRHAVCRPETNFSKATGLLLAQLETVLHESGSRAIGIASFGRGPLNAILAGNLAFLSAACGRNIRLIDADCRNAYLTDALRTSTDPEGKKKGLPTRTQIGSAELRFVPAESWSRTGGCGGTELSKGTPDAARNELTFVALPDDMTEGATHRCMSVLDEVLLVVESGRSSLEEIHEQIAAIRGHEDRICGVILVT